jgi:diaminopimelate epimerase
MLALAKAHAYGNDFLFVPAEEAEGLALDALSRRLCDRHAGVGGDGVIFYSTAPNGTARMRLVNADGSPSELSGNGLRCLGALLLHQREAARLPPVTELRVDTDAGWKTLTLVGRMGGRYTFRAAMGQPEHVARATLRVADELLEVSTLTMCNPQCVTFVKDLPGESRFNLLGPGLATHPHFAAGTNVEFAVVDSPSRVRILIWERGVGPTLASGTGACASAVAAMAHQGASRDIEVTAPGGTQRVEWRDDGVYLTGWAEVVFDGHWVPAHAGLP